MVRACLGTLLISSKVFDLNVMSDESGFLLLLFILKFRKLFLDGAELCASRLLPGVYGIDLGVECLLFYDEGL